MPALDALVDEIINEGLNGVRLEAEQREALRRIAQRSSHEFLKNSAKELRGALKVNKRKGKDSTDIITAPEDLIDKIYRVYRRKISENARMFHVFHVFESAWRTKLSIWLEDHYNSRKWWLTLLLEFRRGLKPADIEYINGVASSHGAIRSIMIMMKNASDEQLSTGKIDDFQSGLEMLAWAKLSDIEEIIYEHWATFKQTLPERLGSGAPLDGDVFKSMFKKVRDARNVCYHHRELKSQFEIFSTAEQLLDIIDIHLEHQCSLIKGVEAKPFSSAIEICDRSRVIPA